jgi:hypothetical protein
MEPSATIPRLMRVDGVDMAIENGVGRHILSSGMATLADSTIGAEALARTPAGYNFIVSSLGRDVLKDAGVLLPLLD